MVYLSYIMSTSDSLLISLTSTSIESLTDTTSSVAGKTSSPGGVLGGVTKRSSKTHDKKIKKM